MSMKFEASKFFVTSDIHFHHGNIIKYCNRPYGSVEEMNQSIVANWNAKVPKDADVFIVGDVAMGGKGKAEETRQLMNKLNGRIHLIRGNHDTYVCDDPCRSRFQWIKDYAEIRVMNPGKEHHNRKLVLFHFPITSWNEMHHGSWHLFGHSHHTLPPDYTKFSVDVGIDGKGYKHSPLSFDDVIELMSIRSFKPADHHGTNEYR